jgi:elongation factor G
MSPPAGFRPQDIRNIALLGHTGSGKTTLSEAILHRCGAVTRMGLVDSASTVSDFEPEARAHGHSTSSTLLFATREDRELNLIDTPGSAELIGQALGVLPAVETAVIVVNAANGIELGTRRLFLAAGEMALARMIVVNKIDAVPNVATLQALVAEIKAAFGPEAHCINLPTAGRTDVIDCFDRDAGDADFGSVADVHREILESSIEVDDAAVERYLAGEAIDLPRLRRCFVEAMNRGHVIPILFTSALTGVGVDDLVHVLVEEAPSPASARPRRLRRSVDGASGELVELPCDPDAPLLGHVFKVSTDPYLGKLSTIRLLQGALDAKTPFVCGPDRSALRAGHLLKLEGRDHPELDSVAYAGDIVTVAKIDDLHVDQIISSPAVAGEYRPILPRYPQPMMSLALEPKNRNDEIKLSGALARLCEEDPTLRAGQDLQTGETLIWGIGEQHLKVTLERLENRFHVVLDTKPPKIAYRETITTRAEGHYRLKKQTGGAGQFAEVFLRVEPLPRGAGFEFASEVFGGAIPTHFIPAVEKGVHDAMMSGPLAGFPVHDVRVVVYDGKSHPVDSKEIAFRSAGKLAFRDAFAKAQPALLEPIVSLEISAPDANVGDVTADLKPRRGRVLGIDTTSAAGTTVIRAHVPLAELGQYGGQLRGLTGGQGTFVTEPAHYDFAPREAQRRLASKRQSLEDEET